MSRAPSDDGPPARRQRTLLGFLKMSSLTRHSLEQIEVAAGTLAPEQTRNHQVWRGPLALYSASPDGTKYKKMKDPWGGVSGFATKPRDLGVKPGSAAPPNLGPRRNQNRPKTQTLA